MKNQNYYLNLYHSCQFKDDDTEEQLKEKVPFHSDPKRKDDQWLTEGYYFWLSENDAKTWNNQYPYTFISHFNCTFNDSDDLYDLVGNSLHIEHFRGVRDSLLQLLRAGKLTPKDEKIPTDEEITVSYIINYLREGYGNENNIFKNIAVKATHEFYKKPRFRFIKKQSPKINIFLPCKMQICIFKINDNVELNLGRCYKYDKINKTC